MTHYQNVTKEVMEKLEKAEEIGDKEAYEKIKKSHGIIDIYDLNEQ